MHLIVFLSQLWRISGLLPTEKEQNFYSQTRQWKSRERDFSHKKSQGNERNVQWIGHDSYYQYQLWAESQPSSGNCYSLALDDTVFNTLWQINYYKLIIVLLRRKYHIILTASKYIPYWTPCFFLIITPWILARLTFIFQLASDFVTLLLAMFL